MSRITQEIFEKHRGEAELVLGAVPTLALLSQEDAKEVRTWENQPEICIIVDSGIQAGEASFCVAYSYSF